MHTRINETTLLTVQLGDKESDKYPLARVYNVAGAEITSVNLTHVESGLYFGNYVFTSGGQYTSVYSVYSDSGRTTLDTDYNEFVNEWIYADQVSTASNITTVLSLVQDILKVVKNNQEIDINNNKLIIYEDDGVTPFVEYNLYDENGVLAYENVFKRTII